MRTAASRHLRRWYKWSTWRLYQGEQETGDRELSPASGTPKEISTHLGDTRASKEKVRWKRNVSNTRALSGWVNSAQKDSTSLASSNHITACSDHHTGRDALREHAEYFVKLTVTPRTDRHRYYRRPPRYFVRHSRFSLYARYNCSLWRPLRRESSDGKFSTRQLHGDAPHLATAKTIRSSIARRLWSRVSIHVIYQWLFVLSWRSLDGHCCENVLTPATAIE